jgi:hypothetical protein
MLDTPFSAVDPCMRFKKLEWHSEYLLFLLLETI